MESVEAPESNGACRNGMGDFNDGPGQQGSCNALENENLGDDFLDDLDSYLEDINDRLTISRMVNDSFIKGMVNAVSQEAAEIVAAKELEVAELKKALHCNQFCSSEFGASLSSRNDNQLHKHSADSFANYFVEPEKLRESLHILNQAATQQVERLEKYFMHSQVPNCKEIGSASDNMGFCGTLQENIGTQSDLNRAFYSLMSTLEAMYQQVDADAYLPKASVEGWKLEMQIRGEMESMVFCTILGSLQEEYERRLWDMKSVLDLIDRFKEISSLQDELDAIQKGFVGPELGHLSLQGSLEMDHLHRKVLSSHGLQCGSLWDANGKCEESKIGMPENLESSQLKHMSKTELYQYFRTEITTMKRDHESTVQQMIEEYFALKREYLKERELLKERGPFAMFRKDEDFEILKKQISEAISKLNGILMDSEKLSKFCTLSRDRLDSLLSENCQLRGLLNEQKLEVSCLSLQAADAARKLSQHSVVEENLHKLVGDLELSIEDGHIEAFISEEVYKSIIRQVASQIKYDDEDPKLMSVIMQDIIEIIYKEAVDDAEIAIRSEYGEILDFESTFMQQMCWLVVQEVLRDIANEFIELKNKCLQDDEKSAFLECKASNIEKELNMMKHHVSMLENLIKENDKSLLEATDLIEKEKEKFHLVNLELNKLKELRTQQEALFSDRNEKLTSLTEKFDDCQKQIDLYMNEVDKLKGMLELSEDKLRKADEEMSKFVAVLKQEQNHLAVLKEREREHRKQMESVFHLIHGLSKSFSNFELRMTENTNWLNPRLENSAFQLHSLVPKVNVLRRTGLLYKERLEKRCSDLQKAEAEVDLLGDEVDALLSLLEKIYVALDHYSPILQHYPGIIEILKLVKRELNAEQLRHNPTA